MTNTSSDYEVGFVKGYKEGRKDGEDKACCIYYTEARKEGFDDAYKEALVKGFERGCAVMAAAGVGYATGRYMGLHNQFIGRRAQLILLGGGQVMATFLVGEDWETKSSLLFDIEEWQIDQDSILEGPNA